MTRLPWEAIAAQGPGDAPAPGDDTGPLVPPAAPVLLWQGGTDGRCTFVNQGWLDFTGRSLEDEIGEGWIEAVHDDDVARIAAQLEAFDRTLPFEMQYRLRRADGVYRSILHRLVPLVLPGGEFTGYVGFASDVTDEVEVTVRLEAQRALLEAVLQQLPAGVIVVDSAGQLLLGNDLVDEMLGPPTTRNDAGGAGLAQYAVYHADGRLYEPHERPLFRALVTNQAVGPVELDVRRPDGEVRFLMASATPVRGRDGNVALAMAVYVDVTERKALEAERAALYERERRFTADVTHDLRHPLATLVGTASLLGDQLGELPVSARRPAELMVDAVGRLRQLVEDLMELARIDAGREVLRMQATDLAAAVGAVMCWCGWEDTVGLDVAADDRAGGVELVTDRRRLERILVNLVRNAIDHGERGVRVRVARHDDDEAFVEVTDGGPGIDPEHLPHLFDRFYKADAGRSRGGSGLGLAIAMENARLLGGTIDAGNRPEGGARFTLRLPVCLPRAGDGERVPRETQGSV